MKNIAETNCTYSCNGESMKGLFFFFVWYKPPTLTYQPTNGRNGRNA